MSETDVEPEGDLPLNGEEIARRRMVNTGESYEEAKAHVAKAFEEMETVRKATPPGWEKAWLEEPYVDPPEEMIDFLRRMPPELRQVALKFPPLCLVKANRPLHCPAPGTVAFVASYNECSESPVSTVQHPGSHLIVQCSTDWLEVVGYRPGLRPEDVRAMIEKIALEEETTVETVETVAVLKKE